MQAHRIGGLMRTEELQNMLASRFKYNLVTPICATWTCYLKVGCNQQTWSNPITVMHEDMHVLLRELCYFPASSVRQSCVLACWTNRRMVLYMTSEFQHVVSKSAMVLLVADNVLCSFWLLISFYLISFYLSCFSTVL